jgi:hypothetical protein
MKRYNQNTLKVSIVDENGNEVPVTQYSPFKDGSRREPLPSEHWSQNLMWSAPAQMKKLWILHQTGFKGTPLDVIMSAPTGSAQYALLMNWYKLKNVERPCIKEYKRFTRDELTLIKECREKGNTYKQIAEKVNHPQESIEDVWYKLNRENMPKRKCRRFSPEELAMIRELRKEGRTYRDIGKLTNRSHGTIEQVCEDIPTKALKVRLNRVAKEMYGYHFSTLLNWKDGAARQEIVREMVERETREEISLFSIHSFLQGKSPFIANFPSTSLHTILPSTFNC